jgi:hypothetical protein
MKLGAPQYSRVVIQLSGQAEASRSSRPWAATAKITNTPMMIAMIDQKG